MDGKKATRYSVHYNHVTNHPSVIYDYDGKKITSVGLTHSDHTKGRSNVPLKKNPIQGDNRKSFALVIPQYLNQRTYDPYVLSHIWDEGDREIIDFIATKKIRIH
jgi:hypothetical protein